MSLKPHDPLVAESGRLAAPVALRHVAGPVLHHQAEFVAVLAFADELGKSLAFAELNKALGGELAALTKEESFTAKHRQRLLVPTLGRLAPKRLLLLGLGSRREATPETLLHGAALATRAANKVGAKSVLLVVPTLAASTAELLELVGRGACLGLYRIARPQFESRAKKVTLRDVQLMVTGVAPQASSARMLRRAETVAAATCLARDLINESAASLYPETFARRATVLAQCQGLTTKVMEPAELARRRMNLLLAVGQGSPRAPRLVHLQYRPPHAVAHIALVGKGITYDSGGLCLKSPQNMADMRMDMGGAAATLAVTLAAAKLKTHVAIDCVLALAENMPSGTALKLGDVIQGAAGKSVEVGNTDAEGRLVLADALHYACQLKPTCIIDVATLTGAIGVALGTTVAGLFANHDALAAWVVQRAGLAGEGLWRLPLLPALKEQLKSEFADLKNTADRHGGAISAALFLKEFVGTTPWVHLDIAGPGMCGKEEGAWTKGGTGFGVATLMALCVDAALPEVLRRGSVSW